jgi:hypothetical protein
MSTCSRTIHTTLDINVKINSSYYTNYTDSNSVQMYTINEYLCYFTDIQV